MTEDARGIVRNVGYMLVILAVAMIVITYGGMLWMDVPMLVLGGLALLYAKLAPAKPAGQGGAP